MEGGVRQRGPEPPGQRTVQRYKHKRNDRHGDDATFEESAAGRWQRGWVWEEAAADDDGDDDGDAVVVVVVVDHNNK